MNGHTTQDRQLSRQTPDDAVDIRPAEGSSLRKNFAACPGGRGDWAGRPTSFCTSPVSSLWGPRLSIHHRTKDAVDETHEPRILSVLC